MSLPSLERVLQLDESPDPDVYALQSIAETAIPRMPISYPPLSSSVTALSGTSLKSTLLRVSDVSDTVAYFDKWCFLLLVLACSLFSVYGGEVMESCFFSKSPMAGLMHPMSVICFRFSLLFF